MRPFLLAIFIAFSHCISAQDTTTIYKNLVRKKFYAVSTGYTSGSGKTEYRVNGKPSDKKSYEKYHATWANMETCTPCILQFYNTGDTLIQEAIMYTDCHVGWIRQYYPNGKLKVTGRYKENPTGNWDDAFDRGFCSVRDGQWVYYDTNGDTMYSESWNNGEFLRQFPEQDSVEIWKVEMQLRGKVITEQTPIKAEDVGLIELVPYYKNSKRGGTFTYKLEIIAVGFPYVVREFTPENFKSVSLKNILAENKIPKKKNVNISLALLRDGKPEELFYLDVKW
jgi:antitoxin component YwqK of YwqJK toxin-antitoxin module